MKLANVPANGTADTMSSGLRRTDVDSAALGPPETMPPETMSGRRSQPAAATDDAPETELPVPAGELLGDKYSVEAVFAEGGMGIVCLGRHVQLDQPVAIKFLRRALSGRPAIVQRFLNEARALAALRSEHVVRVMDVGQLDSGRPYLVMEHLDGVHLEALLESQGPLSIETALSYVLQICEPLSEAHALGIVHRDIKPENLFLWSGGPAKDTVKVLDFGLAKQLGSAALGVTGPQDSLGSPGYMSPEQITTPQLVDARSDIWSLGVVLYRLLSNALPFGGNSMVEVLSHILNAAPTPLREVAPGTDAELEAIILRCLEKAPAARYETMSQLADALRIYLADRQRLSVPAEGETSAREAASRPGKKADKIRIPGVHSRWPAGLAALAVLVLVAGALYAADRSGRIRLRDLSDGWLTPARLAADPAANTAPSVEQPALPFFRASSAAEPARDQSGARMSHAVRERDSIAAPSPAAAPVAPEPMSNEEAARRKAGYRDYLTSEGLTPLNEAEPATEAESTTE